MRREIIFTILIISTMILGYWFYAGWGIYLLNPQTSIERQRMREITDQRQELALIEGNTLVGVSVMNYVSPQTLGMLVLMEKIIFCESGGDPTAKNPKSTAYGLCQFLDGTWDYVQKKWDMKLDRQSVDDQLYACQRLLEEEGLKHWKPVWQCIGHSE